MLFKGQTLKLQELKKSVRKTSPQTKAAESTETEA
jgi:hypothetical protein